jgi:hypothetical protein
MTVRTLCTVRSGREGTTAILINGFETAQCMEGVEAPVPAWGGSWTVLPRARLVLCVPAPRGGVKPAPPVRYPARLTDYGGQTLWHTFYVVDIFVLHRDRRETLKALFPSTCTPRFALRTLDLAVITHLQDDSHPCPSPATRATRPRRGGTPR